MIPKKIVNKGEWDNGDDDDYVNIKEGNGKTDTLLVRKAMMIRNE